MPDGVKEAIAGMTMTGSDNIDTVMKKADDVYFSTRNKLTATAAVSEVAAFRGKGRGNRRGRGNYNGNQSNGSQRQSTTPATNASTTSQKPKWGQKHPDGPPDGVCKQHYQHGKSAHF